MTISIIIPKRKCQRSTVNAGTALLSIAVTQLLTCPIWSRVKKWRSW